MQLFQTMRFGNILFLGAFWNTVCHDFFFPDKSIVRLLLFTPRISLS